MFNLEAVLAAKRVENARFNERVKMDRLALSLLSTSDAEECAWMYPCASMEFKDEILECQDEVGEF